AAPARSRATSAARVGFMAASVLSHAGPAQLLGKGLQFSDEYRVFDAEEFRTGLGGPNRVHQELSKPQVRELRPHLAESCQHRIDSCRIMLHQRNPPQSNTPFQAILPPRPPCAKENVAVAHRATAGICSRGRGRGTLPVPDNLSLRARSTLSGAWRT